MVFSIAHRTVAGFDWDTGDRAKCQQHGVSLGEIEGARYMHQKEIELYEEKNPDLRDR